MDHRVLSGAGWMVAMKFSIRGLGMLSILILARLLSPEDFGLVAMATSIVALLDLLRAFSFDIVLIQRTDAERKHFDSAWTLNLIFAALLAFLLFVLSNPAAAFFQEPRLVAVIRVIAISVLLQGVENIGVVYFRKHFQFGREFRFMLSKKLVSFLVTLGFAFWLQSYWALVFGIVSSAVAGVVFSYLMQSYRPRINLSAIREIFSFSMWLQLNSILFFFRHRSVDFVVGRLVGSQGLGLLTLATEVSTVLTSELVQPINRALFPGYAAMAESRESIRASFLQVVAGIGLVVLPLGVGLTLAAPDFVPIAFGDDWQAAVVPIQILAIYSTLVAVQGNNGLVFLAIGKPRILTLTASISVVIAIPLLIGMTIANGVIGACLALLMSVIAMLPVNYFYIRREIHIFLMDFATILWRPVVATSIMYIVTSAIQRQILTESLTDHIFRLTVTVATGVLIYTAAIIGLWLLSGRPKGAEQFLFDKFNSVFYRLQTISSGKSD